MSESGVATAAEVLAEAFRAEGCRTVFGLMGDGNMRWMSAMEAFDGLRVVHTRHENTAVAMADGYYRSSRRVGVASITGGPGLTQALTSLTTAARHGSSLVVFAGHTAVGTTFDIQAIDYRPLVEACGARLVSLAHLSDVADRVRDAFFYAKSEKRPVVMSVPYDLQEQEITGAFHDYEPSGSPPNARLYPDLRVVEAAADAVIASKRPIVIAGRGAHDAGAVPALEALAAHVGALLATTLRAKGLFDGHPYALGIAGGFASDLAAQLFLHADCVIGVGARMGHYTSAGGTAFPNAMTIQIDADPKGRWEGQKTADLLVAGDARATVEALHSAIEKRVGRVEGFRTSAVAAQLDASRMSTPKVEVEPHLFDPSEVVGCLDREIAPDHTFVMGVGHYWHFAATGLTGRSPDDYMFTYDFGAIGQGLSTAMGAALGDPRRRFVVLEGDGGVMMSLQALDTAAQEELPILLVVFNDGAFGAEVHKLAALGLPYEGAIYGRTDFAGISRALGIEGHRLKDLRDLPPLIRRFDQLGVPMVVDVPISRTVLSLQMQRRTDSLSACDRSPVQPETPSK